MTAIALGSGCDFVDLSRTFTELPNRGADTDDQMVMALAFRSKRLCWPDLLQKYRLIILSEAGSGKTWELRNAANVLAKQGKPAFFLRLEHIPQHFEVAFEVGTYGEFTAWLDSPGEGWLLLDSVDEARLRSPSDFELAIHILSQRISKAQDRAHIFVTGRTSAWRPKTDLAVCESCFPFGGASDAQCTQVSDDGTRAALKTQSKDGPSKVFTILALDDLTPDQIAEFVRSRGIKDGRAFLDAVERADAWSFTSRPQDLEELTEFWLNEGRIGSRLEIVRNSVNRRLAERDQTRAEAYPLSAEKSAMGAKLLAATTTLTGQQTINIPDGAQNAKGIAVQAALSDWDDKSQLILLSRPIFDEAIYGTVRFHHRSVREYLAADWFADLLRRETSRRTIEALFFRNQYGIDIVVPRLRPLLPWLAIFDERICSRIQTIAPEILFEGGDPGQLPLDIRRHILRDVCKRIANRSTDCTDRDYSAVQRFACPELTDDIRSLFQQYSEKNEIVIFLLRMVWLGQLRGAISEVTGVALSSSASQYSRIEAFKALKAIGSEVQQEHIRQRILADESTLTRELFAELLAGTVPTEKSLSWLSACLEKVEPAESHTADFLALALAGFIGNTPIELLPKVINTLNELLSRPPLVEDRYCDVSIRFQWLMEAACKAMEKLILARHPDALNPDAVAVLHKYSAVEGYGQNRLTSDVADFAKLVGDWKELNRALFWFDVHRARESHSSSHGGRLTAYWEVPCLKPLWRFEARDFDDLVNDLTQASSLDDRLVALSLTFCLYKEARRLPYWRERMKTATKDNRELSAKLAEYLKPAAQCKATRKSKQQQARWKRRREAEQAKHEKHHADWKNWLNEHIEEAKAALRTKPGVVTNALWYLFDQAGGRKSHCGRWTDYNWMSLVPQYGTTIAQFYRDGAVAFWRNYEPRLQSEGAPPNETPYAVVIGLVGLEIEAKETKDWPKCLSRKEAALACKYAACELNGFPSWFPKLFETYPDVVHNFLMHEMRYELSIEKEDVNTNYMLDDISESGQWAWNSIAPEVYEILKAKEPQNLSNLGRLLKLLQHSTLSDGLLEELASHKCSRLKKLDHLANWFAVWTGVAPEMAIRSFQSRIGSIRSCKKQTEFAMNYVTRLMGSHGRRAFVRDTFRTPTHLGTLYELMHQYIRRRDDIDRIGTGCFSPELRDEAQEAREGLFHLLTKIPGKESFLAIMTIAQNHPEEAARPWMMLRAKSKAEQDGDLGPWTPWQVREFHDKLDRTPCNHKELAELAVLRLQDLKDDLENGDSSIASILQPVKYETEIRKFIGHELREKAGGRYVIPQEEELADAKRPDLRFHGMGFDGPVPVELKVADNWRGQALLERLENQLCGDYLRDNRSGHGIYVLVYRGITPQWRLPGIRTQVNFTALLAALQEHWVQIAPKFPNVEDITVIGIDLTARSK